MSYWYPYIAGGFISVAVDLIAAGVSFVRRLAASLLLGAAAVLIASAL